MLRLAASCGFITFIQQFLSGTGNVSPVLAGHILSVGAVRTVEFLAGGIENVVIFLAGILFLRFPVFAGCIVNFNAGLHVVAEDAE